MRSLILFGAGGQLGSSILQAATAAYPNHVIKVPWAEAGTWSLVDAALWFSRQSCLDAADVILANGLTDPSLPREELDNSNAGFPINVIEAGQHFPGLRFMTIGTVMEERASLSTANGYVASKLALCNHIRGLAERGLRGRVLHLRLHTLYGVGQPHPHMFLGQMLEALRLGRQFPMSSGRQYRQYHHAQDIAAAILAIAQRDWPDRSVLQLNSAETMQLRHIAEAVFKHFGSMPLLQIGALPEQTGDVVEEPHYLPTDRALFPRSRPAIANIIKWFIECQTA